MALVTKGRTFVSGEVVTPTKLNTLVDGATVSGIVNADIDAAAAIADSKLATIATAGKVSNSATTATSANTASAIVARDASGNFSAETVTASLNGNAATATTATKLATTTSGSAPAYACRAWVSFDATKDTTGASSTSNTNRLIRASGNVVSVTRNSVGNFTVVFATGMANANYVVVVGGGTSGTQGVSIYTTARTTGSCTIQSQNSVNQTLVDFTTLDIAIFA